MKVDHLVPSEAEHLLARSLGYHVRSRNTPYVMIDDWSKPGTVVNSCRFQPMSDKSHWQDMAKAFNVKTVKTEKGWMAGVLTEGIKLILFDGGRTEGEAIVRCLLKSMYPEEIPEELLLDNPL